MRSEVDKHLKAALKDLERHTQRVYKLWRDEKDETRTPRSRRPYGRWSTTCPRRTLNSRMLGRRRRSLIGLLGWIMSPKPRFPVAPGCYW